MTDDEKLDKMVALAERASQSDIAYRLASAMTTDALVSRIIGPENPDAKSIIKGMTKAAIVQAADREFEQLGDDERERLGGCVVEKLQQRIVAATRHCWTVATMLGYPPDILNEEAVAWIAAVSTIPVDASYAVEPE